jgi:dihydrofolate reductase
VNFIVAVDENWNIGRGNDLLFRLSPDLKNFRKLTLGKVVIMGRATLQSLPGGKPLPGRTNIVLSSDPLFEAEGATVVHNMEELFSEIKRYDSNDVFVIGGASIYNQMMDYCDKAYITKIFATAEADRTINRLDGREGWELAEQGPPQQQDGLTFSFFTYENNMAKQI